MLTASRHVTAVIVVAAAVAVEQDKRYRGLDRMVGTVAGLELLSSPTRVR